MEFSLIVYNNIIYTPYTIQFINKNNILIHFEILIDIKEI